MGRQHKQQGPRNLAAVADRLEDDKRYASYIIQRGTFRAWLTTTADVAEGFERRGYDVRVAKDGETWSR